jgi:hypothetical protein
VAAARVRLQPQSCLFLLGRFAEQCVVAGGLVAELFVLVYGALGAPPPDAGLDPRRRCSLLLLLSPLRLGAGAVLPSTRLALNPRSRGIDFFSRIHWAGIDARTPAL